MKCPICHKNNTTVVGGKYDKYPVKRYRRCLSCGVNFQTVEYYTDKTLRDVKKNCTDTMKEVLDYAMS